MRPMRILILLAAVSLLTACDRAPTEPVAPCTPGDTVRSRFPLVSADKRDTVWATSSYVCPHR